MPWNHRRTFAPTVDVDERATVDDHQHSFAVWEWLLGLLALMIRMAREALAAEMCAIGVAPTTLVGVIPGEPERAAIRHGFGQGNGRGNGRGRITFAALGLRAATAPALAFVSTLEAATAVGTAVGTAALTAR